MTTRSRESSDRHGGVSIRAWPDRHPSVIIERSGRTLSPCVTRS
ncbi:hypothetical protein N136_02629 [Leifsonia aquatica ATCC 14665]|uniref:Uncharacterized protein n=1 Tax=Leifsonia aquatica ATCC 14665 TaxID=1358026 RepID=U2R731_LEIAQ|nr:hypothetical protein N136_02629 [Leifsonia aquatica ATCC 14665]